MKYDVSLRCRWRCARAEKETTRKGEGGVRELAGKVCLLNECIYRAAVDDVLPCLVE